MKARKKKSARNRKNSKKGNSAKNEIKIQRIQKLHETE